MVTYHRPATLNAALTVRAAHDVMVLAGGTDIYPAKAARAGWGDMHHKDILDITRLADLRGVSQRGDHWRIGALTTWTDLMQAPLPPLFDGYKRAAREVGGAQIQNRGTLAGNICTASPAGDGIPNLLALDARIELTSLHAQRTVPISAFIDGYRHTICRGDEIVTAIVVPKPRAPAHSHFLKLGARKYLVISIVMAAGVIELDAAGIIRVARLAVGACSAVPQRLPALEAALASQPIDAAPYTVTASHFAHLAPIDDIRASSAFRSSAAVAVTRDLLSELAAAQRRGGA
jgi:xanthine dehydrogenase small subunit